MVEMQSQTHYSWADPIPPWPDPGLWQAANRAMDCAVHRNLDVLQNAMDLAQQIHTRIEALDPLMRDLGDRTCPSAETIVAGGQRYGLILRIYSLFIWQEGGPCHQGN